MRQALRRARAPALIAVTTVGYTATHGTHGGLTFSSWGPWSSSGPEASPRPIITKEERGKPKQGHLDQLYLKGVCGRRLLPLSACLLCLAVVSISAYMTLCVSLGCCLSRPLLAGFYCDHRHFISNERHTFIASMYVRK